MRWWLFLSTWCCWGRLFYHVPYVLYVHCPTAISQRGYVTTRDLHYPSNIATIHTFLSSIVLVAVVSYTSSSHYSLIAPSLLLFLIIRSRSSRYCTIPWCETVTKEIHRRNKKKKRAYGWYGTVVWYSTYIHILRLVLPSSVVYWPGRRHQCAWWLSPPRMTFHRGQE